jgi:hypothetical protein
MPRTYPLDEKAVQTDCAGDTSRPWCPTGRGGPQQGADAQTPPRSTPVVCFANHPFLTD